MLTFLQHATSTLEEGVVRNAINRLLKRKKAKPQKDSPHYKTKHHYGHGDIEPSSVPVFKPTWMNKPATV